MNFHFVLCELPLVQLLLVLQLLLGSVSLLSQLVVLLVAIGKSLQQDELYEKFFRENAFFSFHLLQTRESPFTAVRLTLHLEMSVRT